jgi:hypothetical protein
MTILWVNRKLNKCLLGKSRISDPVMIWLKFGIHMQWKKSVRDVISRKILKDKINDDKVNALCYNVIIEGICQQTRMFNCHRCERCKYHKTGTVLGVKIDTDTG